MTAAGTPPPPAAAVARGHLLEHDGPDRWTCQRAPICRDAALIRHGNVYGSAVDRRCPGAPDTPAVPDHVLGTVWQVAASLRDEATGLYNRTTTASADDLPLVACRLDSLAGLLEAVVGRPPKGPTP